MRPSATPGEPFSAATPSPTESTSPPSIAWAWKKPPAASAGLEFWGSSFICDPFGVVLAEASTDREEILLAEIDLARIEDVRRNWPFLRDRRIDAYAGITSRFLDEDPWRKKARIVPTPGT